MGTKLKLPRNDTRFGCAKANLTDSYPQRGRLERNQRSPFVVFRRIKEIVSRAWIAMELSLKIVPRGCHRSGIELLLGCIPVFCCEIGCISSILNRQIPLVQLTELGGPQTACDQHQGDRVVLQPLDGSVLTKPGEKSSKLSRGHRLLGSIAPFRAVELTI
jgi:hypothetical protein